MFRCFQFLFPETQKHNCYVRGMDRENLDSRLLPCSEILFFLLGDTPVSELYVPTFRNTLPVPYS